jgi:DNA-binding LacI/PurR family transcriptional regulator
MLAQSDRPTACICYSTIEAFWLLSACGAMGLSVPKDLSIIALDDNASIADSWPELGRISFDRYAMGRCAAEMMLERLENKTVVPPSLNFAKHQILGSTFAHPSS